MIWLKLLSGPLALSGLLMMLLLLLLLPPLSLLEDSVSQESWKMGFLLLLLVWGGRWLSSSLPFLLLFLELPGLRVGVRGTRLCKTKPGQAGNVKPGWNKLNDWTLTDACICVKSLGGEIF